MYESSLLCLLLISLAHGNIFDRFDNYTKIFGFTSDESSNELWRGIIKDCSKKVSFSCIQKNAYTFLDRTFIDRANITVFEGLSLTRNNLNYDACTKEACTTDNLVERRSEDRKRKSGSFEDNHIEDDEEEEEEEQDLSPLEEVTHALRKKTFKFLATRDYEIQLPKFIAGGASLKISPREIDERGAVIRVDFGSRALEEQQHGRLFFKKIKKQIKNKLLMGLLILILLIKIIKLKFMFVIPFLFGVGTAKKLFLKLLLFLVPAFGHVFKLCSSYYSSHATKYHQHHHKIIHHHEHVPVPVPVPFSKPVYYDHPPSHSHGSSPPYVLDDDFNGFDYAHPHIQYRKDIEELKEWGIEPYDESYDQVAPQAGVIYPGPSPTTPSALKSSLPKFPFGVPPQYMSNARPMGPGGFIDKINIPPNHPQNLAYSGYRVPPPLSTNNRPPAVPAASLPVGVVAAPFFGPPKPSVKPPPGLGGTGGDGGGVLSTAQASYKTIYDTQQRNDLQHQASTSAAAVPVAVPPTRKPYDDEFYGPIVERLDEIFNQMRFIEEPCRERLVCSMYKNPSLYSPNSNIISNELSRDPHELQQGNTASASSQRFHRYLGAARTGQDGGDCLRSYHCSINTE